MGREVKRIDLRFDWFGKHRDGKGSETWKGYVLGIELLCPLCEGITKDKPCPLCWDDKYVIPKIEPPFGDGWQMWEDVSEGSPMSPVFKTPEELATWLADNKASAFGSQTATYEEWLGMIKVGSSPCGVGIVGKGIISGVKYVANQKE